MEGVWKSEVPPKPGLAVDVKLDRAGQILAITAMSESQLAQRTSGPMDRPKRGVEDFSVRSPPSVAYPKSIQIPRLHPRGRSLSKNQSASAGDIATRLRIALRRS